MLNNAKSDSLGDVARAFLADLSCALILERLVLYEGKCGTEIVTCEVGVVAVCQLPKFFLCRVSDNGLLSSVELECLTLLDKCIGTIAQKNQSFGCICEVDQSKSCVELVCIRSYACLGDSPAVCLNRTPGLCGVWSR